jgi:hypothetical protein
MPSTTPLAEGEHRTSLLLALEEHERGVQP